MITCLDALAWSGWVWAGCIYIALWATRRERDHWYEAWHCVNAQRWKTVLDAERKERTTSKEKA